MSSPRTKSISAILRHTPGRKCPVLVYPCFLYHTFNLCHSSLHSTPTVNSAFVWGRYLYGRRNILERENCSSYQLRGLHTNTQCMTADSAEREKTLLGYRRL